MSHTFTKVLTHVIFSTKERWEFAWQEGYGAFSLGPVHVPEVVKYIAGQKDHHRTVSFQEEFISFLQKNGIEYDERYIWK
jgi:hypothetical protein